MAYPIARSGGLFLLLIGLTMVAALFARGARPVSLRVFWAGAALAVLSLFLFTHLLSSGPPTRPQVLALIGAILLQVVGIAAIQPLAHPQTPRDFWLWLLFVVGLHFLPMALAFGPRMAALGLLCMLDALAGLWLRELPLPWFGYMDAALKIGFGLWLLFSPPVATAVAGSSVIPCEPGTCLISVFICTCPERS